MAKARDAKQFNIEREVPQGVLRVVAYPDEVSLQPLQEDIDLTPAEALELAAILISASKEAERIEWANEDEDDGLLVRVKK